MLTEEMKKLIWDNHLNYSPDTLLAYFKQSSPASNENHDAIREICKSTAMNAIQKLTEIGNNGDGKGETITKLVKEYKKVFEELNENCIIFNPDIPLYALKALYEALLAKEWIVSTSMKSFFANCYQDAHTINSNSLSNAGSESKPEYYSIRDIFPKAPKRGHRVEDTY